MPEQTDSQPFGEWCIVEQLGHRRLAGYVQEVQLAGAGFLRLDVPPAGEDPGRTQYLSPGSVYALHPVSEETARRAAGAWRPAPVQRWELPAAEVDDREESHREWAAEGHALAVDPDPDHDKDLDDEDEDDHEHPF